MPFIADYGGFNILYTNVFKTNNETSNTQYFYRFQFETKLTSLFDKNIKVRQHFSAGHFLMHLCRTEISRVLRIEDKI